MMLILHGCLDQLDNRFAFNQSAKTLCELERLPKTRPRANQNAKQKQPLEQRSFMQTKMLAEKGRRVFLPEL